MPAPDTTGEIEKWIGVLRAWGSIGSELANSHVRDNADWDAVRRIIEVARKKLVGDRERLRDLLEKSRRRLHPLNDPFDVDLGMHRWLAEDREEAYSDWLEWVVQQAPSATHVFELFGLSPPDRIDDTKWNVARESCVPHGHVDREGRLDLVICFGQRAMIVVEVKKGDADEADTAKHRGYNIWIDEQVYSYKKSVLLAVSAEQEEYEGFSFCSWQSVCIEMRRLASDIRKAGSITTAAIVLAFVAAVEQNLLGFSQEIVRGICDKRLSLFNVGIVDHLERFIERTDG